MPFQAGSARRRTLGKHSKRPDKLIEKELVTLVLLFVFAIIGGILAARFKQPVVLGLLIVGTLVGPFALNIVNDQEMINMMIDFGAILLLFVVGLEFSAKKLIGMGVKVLIVAAFKIGIMFFIGFMASILFGLGVTTAIFIGIIFSFTSTVIVVKILEQKDLIKRAEVPVLLGVLIIEDIIAVAALTLLSGAVSAGSAGVFVILEKLIISITIMIAVYVVVSKFADRILAVLSKNATDEMITFISLALCAGFAYLAYILGISPSAGAFLAGSIISSVKDSKTFGRAVLPHSMMFSSLFFIAIGTLIDFRAIIDNATLILFLLGVLLIARFISVGLSTYLFANMRKSQPLFSSIAMISIGEFSLLIAKQASAFNVTIDLVTITAILIFLSSVIMSVTVKTSEKLYAALAKERPGRFKRKMNALRNYISSFLEQLDTESSYTNRFKKYMARTAGLFLLSIFILIGAHKLAQLLLDKNMSTLLISVVLIALISAAVFVLYLTVINGREAYKLSVSITSYIDKSMNVNRASKTLKSIGLGLIIILIGLASPGIIFMLQLPAIYSLISLGIVLIGIYVMSRVFKLLFHFSNDFAGYVPDYRKYDPEIVRFQKRRYD
jgi:Kef-type K+ transport system membrane component KefB